MAHVTQAICGRSCSLTIGTMDYDVHQASLNLQVAIQDVTSFGSGAFGSFIGCHKMGTISGSLYGSIPLQPGDSVVWTMTFGYNPEVVLNGTGLIETITQSADAKGLVENAISIRLTEDVTRTLDNNSSSSSGA